MVAVGWSITGGYAILHFFHEVYAVYASTLLVGPIRGAGRADAIFLVERLSVNTICERMALALPVNLRKLHALRGISS